MRLIEGEKVVKEAIELVRGEDLEAKTYLDQVSRLPK
jgi:hypothetical protein